MSQVALRLVETSDMDRQKALDSALSQIERAFGKGSIMKMGETDRKVDVDVVSTGWEAGQVMTALGLPVARPLAVLVERRFGIPARAVLLMEYVGGTALADLVEGSTDPATLKDVARQLREAFACMEKHRIVHGDLKASNIIIRSGGRVALIDIDAAEVAVPAARFRDKREKDRHRFLRNWQRFPEAAEIFRDVFDKIPPPA